jgi:endonuclease-3
VTPDVEAVLKTLKREFPNPGAMELGDPYRTIVAVILSARTRDEQVLKLLPKFFDAFPTPQKLGAATTEEIEGRIDTIGMYRQKAKNVKRLGEVLMREFGGQVPKSMDELVTLPGVGRKTASVVLVACFAAPAIAVDTHVLRVTNRLGWVKTKTPEKTEIALLKIVPTRLQRIVNQVFVKFGRYICIGGKPRCWMCPIREHCAFTRKNLVVPKDADEIKADLKRRERALETLREKVLG